MRRTELLRKIAKQAKAAELPWILVRQGGGHEVWACGSTKVTIPRHTEVVEYTAQAICKQLEKELGKGWWR